MHSYQESENQQPTSNIPSTPEEESIPAKRVRAKQRNSGDLGSFFKQLAMEGSNDFLDGLALDVYTQSPDSLIPNTRLGNLARIIKKRKGKTVQENQTPP